MQIRAAQSNIAQVEVRIGSTETATVDQGLDRFLGSLRIAWKDGEVRPTHRKPITGPRSWRTHADPFESSWATIELWLNEQPDAMAKSLFQRLQENLSEQFEPSQLRTLQRRVKQWRTEIARRLVLGVETESEDVRPQTEKQEQVVIFC